MEQRWEIDGDTKLEKGFTDWQDDSLSYRRKRLTALEALEHPWIKGAHDRIINQLHQDDAQRNYAIGALISLDQFATIETQKDEKHIKM